LTRPRALVLYAPGTNREGEACAALDLAGAEPQVVPLTELKGRSWLDYQLLILPGGFSYADALGAGRLWALELRQYFAEHVEEFIASGRPVLGICNGFQALVKGGFLPEGRATLAPNAGGSFQCRWVRLQPQGDRCLWTRGLEAFDCPIAHGEGRFLPQEPGDPDSVALTYAALDEAHPGNPNGSWRDAAGVTNAAGNVLGLMPHPENHLFPWQHPRHARGQAGALGLALFQAGVRHA
jgi:phosphoribosylformylglycinamidine synthase